MNLLVIGAGFAGATFARLAAEDGIKVSIIDKRDHIGGNSYSFLDKKTGIEIHKYGPHIFHTNSDVVFKFISRFTDLNSYVNRVKGISNGQIYSLPINLHTINQFFGKCLSPTEAKRFIETQRVEFSEIKNFEEYVLNSVGNDLYEAFFRDYTIKQWGIEPSKIPISTAKRLPLRFNYNDNYFDDKYQGIPEKGYGKLFEAIIGHENIKISLSCDYNDLRHSWRKKYDFLVFTGSIDEYFNYKYGELPYRTVAFEKIRAPEIQGNAVINYCDSSVKYTRIHEHKYFMPEKQYSNSIAFKEYSDETNSKYNPFYPVENQKSSEMMLNYSKLAQCEKNVLFLGRLGSFKYLNMDQVIANSMEAYRRSNIDDF